MGRLCFIDSERYGHVMKKRLVQFCIVFAFILVIVSFSNVSLGADRLDLPMDSRIAFFNGLAIPMDVAPLLQI
jgi:hypothetical protein